MVLLSIQWLELELSITTSCDHASANTLTLYIIIYNMIFDLSLKFCQFII